MVVRDALMRFEAVDGPPLFEIETNLCITPAVLIDEVLIGGAHGLKGHFDVYKILALDEVKVYAGRHIAAIIGCVKGVPRVSYRINKDLVASGAGVAVALGAAALGKPREPKKLKKLNPQ